MSQKLLAKHKNTKGKSADGKAMWGGHFSHGPAEAFAAINPSIAVDQRLWREDIEGSIAHANMLAACGIISKKEAATLVKGLQQIHREIESGSFIFKTELEDIHLNIESRLKEIVGDVAGTLHTARSRNDQVATDMRLYVRRACDVVELALKQLQQALLTQATQHTETMLPGYTHLQPAQPIVFAHHLLAYVEMFGRDRTRVLQAKACANECPLGAAALAGTPHPINREMTSHALGFSAPMANAMDAVSSRDYLLETLSALSICAMHMSRLCEELIFWSNPRIGFVTLHESFTSGSSIMPQKRNPDAAELIRGKASGIAAAYQSVWGMLKALPLAYNKDMQEDKRAFFVALDDSVLCLQALGGMVATLTVNADAMKSAVSEGFLNATDLADYLVKQKNMPFRKAHHVTGTIVKRCETLGVTLETLSLREMQKICKIITADVFDVIALEASVAARTSVGGTAPVQVKRALANAKKRWL
jgi:argininosuccinate lyase